MSSDSTSQPDGWDPAQYNKFAEDRERPFWDLAAMIHKVPSPQVIDLGCGDGRLAAELARVLGASSLLGVDSSPAMITSAQNHRSAGVDFVASDIETWSPRGGYDIVFSNAAIHWVRDHEAVLTACRAALDRGGQLAIQVPANADHRAHELAGIVASEFLPAPPPDAVAVNVLSPERYAELLHELGFVEQRVRLEVYAQELSTTSAVVEWVKGSSLTRFKDPMGPENFERFVDAYRARLVTELGELSPYFYLFKRILVWGRLAQ